MVNTSSTMALDCFLGKSCRSMRLAARCFTVIVAAGAAFGGGAGGALLAGTRLPFAALAAFAGEAFVGVLAFATVALAMCSKPLIGAGYSNCLRTTAALGGRSRPAGRRTVRLSLTDEPVMAR